MPSKRRLSSSIALACLAWAGAVSAVDFAGTGVGPIPDYPNPGRTVAFNVAGIAQPLSDIRLKLSMSHSFIGDLKVVLTSPSGIAHLAIFGRMYDTSELNGTYTFDDDASYDLWTAAAQLGSDGVVPPGRYRTSSMGLYYSYFDRGKNGVPTEESRGLGLHSGGCVTTLGGAFGGLTPQQANGQWTLQFVDEQEDDVGTISAAVLVLNDGAFASGFEEPLRSQCTQAPFDFTGSGRTSYGLLRCPPSPGAIEWIVKDNNGDANGEVQQFLFGLSALDRPAPGDFDGDAIADAAVLRAGTYIVRRSSRPTDSLLTIPVGPADSFPLVGDFDGDEIDDAAVWWQDESGGSCATRVAFRSSMANVTRNIELGNCDEEPLHAGDYNGDGRADVAALTGAGSVYIYDCSNLNHGVFIDIFGLEAFPMGDVKSVVPGDYNADGIADIAAVGYGSAAVVNEFKGGGADPQFWSVRNSVNGSTTAAQQFGTDSDRPLAGDYDGDGAADYAFWRPSGFTGFNMLIDNQPLSLTFGTPTDKPIASVWATQCEAGPDGPTNVQ